MAMVTVVSVSGSPASLWCWPIQSQELPPHRHHQTPPTSRDYHPISHTNHCHQTDLIHPSPKFTYQPLPPNRPHSPITHSHYHIQQQIHLSFDFKTNSVTSSKNCSIFHSFHSNLIAYMLVDAIKWKTKLLGIYSNEQN